jgi:hypothetical protein
VIEHEVFGDSGILVIAPHEGVGPVEIDGKTFRIGESGTAHLARLAAEHVGGACLVSRVPRAEADFARDPALLGKGAPFSIRAGGSRQSGGRRVTLKGHTNRDYAGLLREFHQIIRESDPEFIIDVHRMSNRDVDVRLGFGRDRRYIGGTAKALEFKKRLLEKFGRAGLSLEVLVSKRRLTGESEFILRNYHKGRKALLVEFAARGFPPGPEYERAVELLAELAKEWLQDERGD